MRSLRDALSYALDPLPAPDVVNSGKALAAPPSAGQPDCPHCQGIGFVRDDHPLGHPNFGKVYLCSCRLPLAAAQPPSRQTWLDFTAPAEKTFETFLPSGRHGLPDQRQSIRLAYTTALKFAQAPEGWLLLRGNTGCGKTHLAAAIANAYCAAGKAAMFSSAAGLLDRLRSTFDPLAWESYDTVFAQLRDCPLLVIDDLGDESPTPWALEKLYQLFNHRSITALPTVVTTRVPPERIDPHIRSRLFDIHLVTEINIDAPDFRGKPGALENLSDLAQHPDCTFDTFDFREQEAHIPPTWLRELRAAYESARHFAVDPRGWLVLAGGHLNGKTHLAAAIGHHCVQQDWPSVFITAAILLSHLRHAFDPNSDVFYDEVFAQLKTAPLLILDDLRLYKTTTWARDKIAHLLDYRYVTGLPTVITTPHKLEQLDARLQVRLNSALSTLCPLSIPPYRGARYRPKRDRRW